MPVGDIHPAAKWAENIGWYVPIQPHEVTAALAEILMPGELVRKRLEQMETTKARYLEQMAAAFVLEVGVPATHIELVQQELPRPQYGWKFFYRIKE
jgi:hypothetical protein